MGSLSVVVGILGGVFSKDAAIRSCSADEVTDIIGSLDDWDLGLVSRSLVSAWLVENVEAAQEAQLHALSELSVARGLPASVRDRLLEVPVADPPKSHREYLEGISEDAASA